jgi:hypothetical protein
MNTIKTITAESLTSSGKKNPASIDKSGIVDDEEDEIEETNGDDSVSIFIPLVKSNIKEHTITGVVLQPEVIDAQGDIIGADVIRKAAHNFLKKYNKATKLGLQHKVFKDTGFELCESYLAPQDVVINGTSIKEGAWIVTVFVGNKKAWDMVENGKLTGFSIGGKAKAVKQSENT